MATIRQQCGKWQARIQRTGFPTLSKTFASKADAIRWGKEKEIELERGNFICPPKVDHTTLLDVLQRYQREITPQKKGAKVEEYRLGVLMRSSLAKMRLAAIRSTDIAKYRDARKAAANTVKNELNTLSAVFEVCRLEWGIEISNAVRGLKRPKAPGGRDRRLYPGEQDILMNACRKSRAWYLVAAVTLAIETGMRLGELSKLRWNYVDLEKRVLTLPDTKNGTARSVPLSTRAVAALKGLPRGFNGAVFPVHMDTMKQSFRSAVARGRKAFLKEKAATGTAPDIPYPMLENLRFHDLRHEACSRLFELGLNPMEVAAISGHKTLAMLKRYTHLRAEDLARRLG